MGLSRGALGSGIFVFALVLGLIGPSKAQALSDPAVMCDRAARQVSDESGVPLDVLKAITRTETGRGSTEGMKPWPWTVNMEGRGVWFDSEAQAQNYVFKNFRAGARSFDVGCFQINYRWHGHAFDSIEAMFDPLLNARYAATFLGDLYAEFGDWDRAVGAYHSRTHKYAARYLKRYEEIRAALSTTITSGPIGTIRKNSFRLLQGSSAQSRAGSLMPQNAGRASALLTRVE